MNDRNEIVIYKKPENLPKEIQDKIIDGTLYAKDGKFQVTVDKNSENKPPTVEARKLYEIREKLSPTAQREFDAMRKTQKSGAEFLEKITKNDPVKMFEAMAKKTVVEPVKQRIDDEALKQARVQIDNSQFIDQRLTQRGLNLNDVKEAQFVVREQISVELTKAKLEKLYPKSQGYEIQTGIKIYKKTEYKTIAEWLKAHPEKPASAEKALVEFDGKVWQPETDIDIAVVKKTVVGKFEVVRAEEIKSGGNSASAKAQEQIKVIQESLEKINEKDLSIKIFAGGKDVTSNYVAGKNIKYLTRGADEKTNFDEKIGLTSKQLDQLAMELLTKYRKGAGK